MTILVEFKSVDPHFTNERSGRKPNTVRKLDMTDIRFQQLRQWNGGGPFEREVYIKIVHAKDPEQFFIRSITDVTWWEDRCIISWRH